MKKSNIILFFSLVLLSCQSNSVKGQMLVGKIENSVTVVTTNMDTLLSNYNKNLFDLSGITGNFTSASIVLVEGNYYLIFTGTDYKSSVLLTSSIDSDGTTMFAEDGGHVSCTTSACASEPRGCVPSNVGQACTPCGNGGTCTKTVSSASMLQEM